MKSKIVQFIRKIKEKHKVEVVYFPDDDIYSVRLKGKAVQNFSSSQFIQIPVKHRYNMIRQLIRSGLNHNVGEVTLQDQLVLNRGQGKKIK